MNSTTDYDKRKSIKLILGSGLILVGGQFMPKKAEADPALIISLLAAITPSIVQAISSLFSTVFSTTENVELEREKLAAQERYYQANLMDQRLNTYRSEIASWLQVGINSGNISYQAAYSQYQNALANLTLSNNFDGNGTSLGIGDGLLYASRGQYGGYSHAGEILESSKFMSQYGDGTIPVPVSHPKGFGEAGRREREAIIQAVGDERIIPAKVRDFSTARNPTADGGNFKIASYVLPMEYEASRGNGAVTPIRFVGI